MKPFNVFPYDSKINFMRLRWVSLAIAALIMFVAIGAMAVKGFNFALDFTGGVGIELRFDKPVDVEDVRARLAKAGFENAAGADLRHRQRPAGPPAGEAKARSDADLGSIAQDVAAGRLHAGQPGRGAQQRVDQRAGRQGAGAQRHLGAGVRGRSAS